MPAPDAQEKTNVNGPINNISHDLFRRVDTKRTHASGLSEEEMAKYIRQRIEFDQMVVNEKPKFSILKPT